MEGRKRRKLSSGGVKDMGWKKEVYCSECWEGDPEMERTRWGGFGSRVMEHCDECGAEIESGEWYHEVWYETEE